ncbi:MAG: wax ester/triacylglycerol synthase family O-acyltransferase [Candidatus Hydrogenedentes bacterium]|nr:wax ester/triacylglycerol synthase family O-acyltransferase [Candidatus Hydrogenedentota bacterium]
MPTHLRDQRLSALDAAFVYLESERMPMHIGAVHIYEGEIPFHAFRKDLDSKIHLVPRYRQRLLPAPLALGHPAWEFDPDFDIKDHVHLLHLEKPGTEAQLRVMVEKVMQNALDRSKPLWEQYVVHGLSGHRSAIISKVHHCLADGVSAVELTNVILDPAPEGHSVEKPPFYAQELPGFRERLVDAVWDDVLEEVTRWTDVQNDLMRLGKAFLPKQLRPTLSELRRLLGWFAGPIDRFPFNVHRLSGRRRVAWVNFSLAELRDIRQAIGGTVNDVVLTALSAGLRRYVRSHGFSPYKRELRIMVPVNLRQERERGRMGNQVSMLPVRVPLDVIDPLERHKVIVERTRALKDAHIADSLHLLMRLVQVAPPPVQALAGKAAQLSPITALLSWLTSFPTVNTVCTNVEGPRLPLFTMGQPLASLYPYLPVGPEMGVSFAFVSYNQRLYGAIVADTAAMPDVAKMKRVFDQSYQELREAAGVASQEDIVVKTQRRRRAKRPAKKVADQAARGKDAEQAAERRKPAAGPRRPGASLRSPGGPRRH